MSLTVLIIFGWLIASLPASVMLGAFLSQRRASPVLRNSAYRRARQPGSTRAPLAVCSRTPRGPRALTPVDDLRV